MDSGASLTILHSDNPSQKSKNTITLEGFDGTISLASQTDNMAFQIGKDEFKEKAWLSRTGDGRSILGSDIMTKRGYVIDYGNNCIWRNPQTGDKVVEISDVHAVHAIKKSEDYDLDALLPVDDSELSELLSKNRGVFAISVPNGACLVFSPCQLSSLYLGSSSILYPLHVCSSCSPCPHHRHGAPICFHSSPHSNSLRYGCGHGSSIAHPTKRLPLIPGMRCHLRYPQRFCL